MWLLDLTGRSAIVFAMRGASRATAVVVELLVEKESASELSLSGDAQMSVSLKSFVPAIVIVAELQCYQSLRGRRVVTRTNSERWPSRQCAKISKP